MQITPHTEHLLALAGLEHKVRYPDGRECHALSADTAAILAEKHGGEVIAPVQGPQMPECFARLRA